MSIRRAQDERIEGTPDGLNAITEIMDVPDTPTIGTATDIGTGSSVSVTFTAAVTGGTPNSYTVTSTPDSLTGTGASSPITVSGLTAGTAYTFKVKAANAAGIFGPESSASNSVTPVLPPVSDSYEALASVTLTGNTSYIEFTNIPTEYRHLQIRGINRDAQTNTNINSLYLWFNGDLTSNGSWKRMEGFGTGTPTVQGYATIGALWIGPSSTNGYGSNIFSSHIIDVLDYNSSIKYKTIKHFGGFDTNGTGTEPGEVNLTSGLWMSLTPVTQITLGNTSYNQVANTSFALYGMK